MPLPDSMFDSAIAFGFRVTVDGVQISSVISVSDISIEVDKVEYNQQTADGKFIHRQLAGRSKGGEFTITRGLTDDKAVSGWIKQILTGDLKGGRKTAEVAILDYQGAPLRTYSFRNVWVKSMKTGQLEAGGSTVLSEDFVMCFDEVEVA